MKKILICLLLLISFLSSQVRAQVLTGFGTSETNPLSNPADFNAASATPWTGTQTTTSVSIASQSNQAGGIYSTLGTPVTISSTGFLQLTGALSGTAPTTNSFFITLYDTSFNSVAYSFDWSSFAGGTQSITVPIVPLDSVGTFNGIVGSYQLTLSGGPGETVSFTFDQLQSVSGAPEPSTYALLGLGLGFLGFCLYRRQRLLRFFSTE